MKFVIVDVTALVATLRVVLTLILMTLSLRKLRTRPCGVIAMALTKPKNDQKWIQKQKQVLETSSRTQMQTYQSILDSGKYANLFIIWT
jgi:hypothetical protein